MKQLWKKIIDNATNSTIKQPYLNASMGVMCGLMVGIWRSNSPIVYVLRLGFLFMAFVHIYFLARAVDKLQEGDPVSQPDELVGMHLNQK